MNAATPLLSIKNLSVAFHTSTSNVKAVDQVSFEIQKGEIVGLVGESGSGKSITARAILGLLPSVAVTQGEILYQNTNLLTLTQKQLQAYRGGTISMIFQEPMSALNPVFRCGRQVMEALLVHKKVEKQKAKQDTLSWLAEVGLKDTERIFNAFPHQLSGGQRQRIMIAMAMITSPQLLLADEPTTALDVTVQKSILQKLKELQKHKELAILFISHDLGVVAEIADRVLVMKDGQIVESSSVQSIFHSPKADYTKQLLRSRPPLHEKVYRLNTAQSQLVDNSLTTPLALLQVSKLSTWFSIKNKLPFQTKKYVEAVKDVSFDIKEGETVGLVGESGSGKTTLGRSILRLVQPRSGTVLYKDKDVLKLPDRAMRSLRQEMQIIFQDPVASLNPRKPIGHAIMEPMKVHKIGQAKERTIELLETVGLEADHFFRLPHEFSGGQRQRIGIARALAAKPKFIVCDECVSSLDVSVQAQILNLLKDLQEQQQLSYLFISHDLSVIRFMSDRILVMQAGQIVEKADADNLFSNPQSPYTQQLLEAIPKGV